MNLLDLSPLSPGSADAPRQPGISSFSNGKWVHGSEALENCRVDPQSTVLDVWENLSLEPVSPSGGMRHRADLAVAQLKALHLDQDSEWCVAVPLGWTKPVVQIFLGVAQECGLTIAGCFPRALMVADSLLNEQQGVVLEWGWKNLYAGTVSIEEGGWHVTTIERVSEGGVVPAFRREANVAADWMLEQHRVDLLHSGSTEQQLFDAWWKWHTGKASAWVGRAGSVQSTLSEQCDGLRDSHKPLLEKLGIANDASVVSPAAFLHLTGFTQWTVESSLRAPEPERLQLEEGKGPRWRETLLCGEGSPEKKRPVTHVVVKGVAEPAPNDMNAQPGDRVTLEDGREGMAIYVPET